LVLCKVAYPLASVM